MARLIRLLVATEAFHPGSVRPDGFGGVKLSKAVQLSLFGNVSASATFVPVRGHARDGIVVAPHMRRVEHVTPYRAVTPPPKSSEPELTVDRGEDGIHRFKGGSRVAVYSIVRGKYDLGTVLHVNTKSETAMVHGDDGYQRLEHRFFLYPPDLAEKRGKLAAGELPAGHVAQIRSRRNEGEETHVDVEVTRPDGTQVRTTVKSPVQRGFTDTQVRNQAIRASLAKATEVELAKAMSGQPTTTTWEIDGYKAEWKTTGGYGVVLVKGAGMPLPLWIIATSAMAGYKMARDAIRAISRGDAPPRGVFRAEGVLPTAFSARYA